MSIKYIELRPNIDLIDANFNGYKLSLEEIPITRQKLSTSVDRVSPNNDQYSLLHARLFALHNHLICDYSNAVGLYYIDTNRCVQKILTEPDSLKPSKPVWEIPIYKTRKEGHFNFSIYFPSPHLAVVSDGAGILHVVETGNRTNCDRWYSLFSEAVIGEENPFIILHANANVEVKTIDCVLLSIEFNNELKHFENVLDWVTIKEVGDKTWKVDSLRRLKGKGELHYCALEQSANAIYIGSEFRFKFVMDSKNEIVEKNENKKLYLWKQTAEDIEVILNTGQKVNKSEVNVICEQDKNLIVSFKDKVILDIKLWLDIKTGLTTWSIDGNDKLSIILQKSQLGFFWSDLAEGGDKYGEQLVDPEEAERVHERLAHLCSESQVAFEGSGPTFSVQQLEECDLATEEMAVLDRVSSETHEVTHRVGLGSNQVLFVMHGCSEPPTLALRHDVDGCIWQPEVHGDWNMKHRGTLSAFGYIQASKEQRKFSTCSPDMTYSVICEANRHVFVYRQTKRVSDGCELRNRVTGARVEEYAQQQVVTMAEEDGDVLGIYAGSDCLYVLTKDKILRLQIL